MAGRYPHDGRHEPHYHDFVEVVLILNGHGMQRSALGDNPIKVGDAFVLRPGIWHLYHDCHHVEVYNCCFGAELLQRELVWIREDPALSYLFWTGPLSLGCRGILHLHLSDASLETCQRHLDALNQVEQKKPIHGRIDQISYLLLLFSELARNISPDQYGTSERAVRPHRAVLDGMHLLEQNLAYPWVLGELAERLHIDRFYLTRLFKGQTGLAPMAYLAHHRAELAASMLLCTREPVAGIGKKAGWPDPNHFARRFKAHFGLSPSAYRAHHIK